MLRAVRTAVRTHYFFSNNIFDPFNYNLMEVLWQIFRRVDQASVPTERLDAAELAAEQAEAKRCLAAGEAWDNWATRESWTVHEDRPEYWEMYETLRSGGFVNVTHVHPCQVLALALKTKWRLFDCGGLCATAIAIVCSPVQWFCLSGLCLLDCVRLASLFWLGAQISFRQCEFVRERLRAP